MNHQYYLTHTWPLNPCKSSNRELWEGMTEHSFRNWKFWFQSQVLSWQEVTILCLCTHWPHPPIADVASESTWLTYFQLDWIVDYNPGTTKIHIYKIWKSKSGLWNYCTQFWSYSGSVCTNTLSVPVNWNCLEVVMVSLDSLPCFLMTSPSKNFALPSSPNVVLQVLKSLERA